jgi:methionyl aminopeptidase
MIDFKSSREIKIMYCGGQLLSEIAAALKEMITPGITTLEVDRKAREFFKKKNLIPSFLNYGTPPFPGAVCASINHERVHGIPSPKRVLKEGDIISIDIGGIHEGFHTDMAFTAGVGKIGPGKQKLIDTTIKALEEGVSRMCAGGKLHDISSAIQETAENAGYNVVRDLVGHGIGRKLHESPQVPNYGKRNTGMKLEEGLVLALEPMLNEGTHKIITREDQWTVETADGKLSAHFENTAVVTQKGPRLLTQLN